MSFMVLKGTGFSPSVERSRIVEALASEGKIAVHEGGSLSG
jgi:hypothetical protein